MPTSDGRKDPNLYRIFMDEFFSCEKGCRNCCPGGNKLGRRIIPSLTMGDVCRSYWYNNQGNMGFFDFFQGNFDWIIHLGKTKEAPFLVLPTTKLPCSYLFEGGCKVHGTVCKFIVCVTSPEAHLPEINKGRAGENIPFDCARGKIVNPAVAMDFVELGRIYWREAQITQDFLTPLGLADNVNGQTVVNESDNPSLWKHLADKIRAFNDLINRSRIEEIGRLTVDYSKASGLKIPKVPHIRNPRE